MTPWMALWLLSKSCWQVTIFILREEVHLVFRCPKSAPSRKSTILTCQARIQSTKLRLLTKLEDFGKSESIPHR